ncbi:hypothetical protein H5410_035894 [Solanum commersonii]|uniref:Uncharacterized protein n=1 Tax=Solanum commersonii TaxID=4109 RepID=A0A9J5Y6I7_SOLCO|nr:hypothetical protein H5410_035894 [Solanum commersonii]
MLVGITDQLHDPLFGIVHRRLALAFNIVCYTRLSLLMQGSIVYPKAEVVTHHHQRFSSLQYLLQMQVEAQQKYSDHTKDDSIFTHKGLII